MSLRGAIGGIVRGTLVAAAVAVAAFGALAVLAPFGAPVPQQAVAPPAAAALAGRIEALRLSLRDTEAALDTARRQPAAGTPYEAQIAAATERRDLALRHARAIRGALKAGAPVAALSGIRDSAVIGQLLARQATLDGELAETGAQLRPTHPTMRALLAQRDTLAGQIRAEAASIAAALEAEAQFDDAQIALWHGEAPTPIATVDTGALEARAAADRAELDALVDAYFDIPAVAPAVTPQADALAPANLTLAGLAGLIALALQVLAARRRRVRERADLAAWRADSDLESSAAAPEAEPLRQAS
jgi:hypothetical protein